MIKNLTNQPPFLETPDSVLLKVSYHKKYHYKWLRDGDRNVFPGNKPFLK